MRSSQAAARSPRVQAAAGVGEDRIGQLAHRRQVEPRQQGHPPGVEEPALGPRRGAADQVEGLGMLRRGRAGIAASDASADEARCGRRRFSRLAASR